ncbi:hypothetical protein HNY73_004824 [Argiope bruennichi]|uniref:Uncharacterized protein n=1 Tax=Argiope bruennichi TaxID=94029 RepID=A0A8T0FQE2_ARGBR|nr:hypothetical protein HNY73_004824 [Argiope bruennichi]
MVNHLVKSSSELRVCNVTEVLPKTCCDPKNIQLAEDLVAQISVAAARACEILRHLLQCTPSTLSGMWDAQFWTVFVCTALVNDTVIKRCVFLSISYLRLLSPCIPVQ